MSDGKSDTTIKAAWITFAAVVIAAVISAVVALSTNGSAGPTPAHPSDQAILSAKPTDTGSSDREPKITPDETATTPTPGGTHLETTGTRSQTFADYTDAGLPHGAPLRSHQTVEVSCRVKGFRVQDGDRWWYRLASPPWNGHYYATSDVFYNNGHRAGNFINGIVVDLHVPVC